MRSESSIISRRDQLASEADRLNRESMYLRSQPQFDALRFISMQEEAMVSRAMSAALNWALGCREKID